MSRRNRSRLAGLSAVAALGLMALPGVANATVTSSVDGTGKLLVTSNAGDAITVTCVVGKVQVNGSAVGGNDCSAITALEVNGGPQANLIDLSGVASAQFTALATPPDVDGGGGNDTINGSQLADTLTGGDGHDRITGDNNPAGTRDNSVGGDGDDTLVWNPGDGDDTNEGGAGNDTIEVNGGNGGEQFTVAPSATVGRIAFDRTGPTPPGPFNLDIGTAERLDLNANGGDDSMTSTTADGFALDIDGGNENDTLDGGDGADLITGGAGNDRIIGDNNPAGTRDNSVGGDGDDTLVWNPGDGDDTNEGGAGNDTIEVNGGGGPEEFEVKPSATPGRVQFDRLGPTPPGPFNLDIGTSERLDFNGNGGDDTLNKNGGAAGLNPFVIDADGGEGNDIIQTGDAPDTLKGGPGNDRLVSQRSPLNTRDVVAGGDGDDTLVWNPGDGDDTMDGEAGNDTIEVNGGNGGEEFEVKPSSTPGRVQFDRLGPTPPGPFNLDIGTSERLELNANGGDDKITGRKGLAGLIKTTLNGGDNNDRIKGTDARDRISGGNGLDLINSRDRAEDRVECDSGFDLALVDKRDTVRGCEIVLGGFLRVKHSAKSASVAGGAAVLNLKCLSKGTCKGKVNLIHGGKSIGSKSYKLKGKKSKTVRIKVGQRGLRLLAKASQKGLKVKLRIDAKDSNGNGWRTTDALRLKR